MQSKQLVIYGAGGFGREVAWLVESCRETGLDCEVACFVDDDPARHGETQNGVQVLSLEVASEQFSRARVVGAVGSPRIRQHLMGKALAAGFDPQTIIHPRVERSRWIEFGAGTVICAGTILTTNIKIGRHVQINLDCTVGHDVILGDYVTLAPGVHVSGWVHFGQRVYVGTGAVIMNGDAQNPILIGDDAVIGAGAFVSKSVPIGLTVVGVAARPLPRH